MRRLISGMVIFALILTSTRMVYAEDKAEIPVIVRIPQMIAMSLDTSELVFDEVDFDYVLGTAQFTRVGVIATKKQAVTATIWGNVHYTLSISAPEEYLTGANGGLLHISPYGGLALSGNLESRCLTTTMATGISTSQIPEPSKCLSFGVS
jgi:hypothetical protein